MTRPLTNEELQTLRDRAERNKAEMVAADPVAKCDRLTVGYGIRHETCGQDPIQAGGNFTVMLYTKQQPYQRRFEVTEQMVNLDTNWIEEPGYIVIENKRALPPGITASKEEKVEHEAHRIYVVVNNALAFEIPAGQAFMAYLSFTKTHAWQHIQLYSSSGACPVNLTVFPR